MKKLPSIKDNPFTVQTPEDMNANDVNELFVDVFTDFYHVPRQGHTFLNGPRGSGKSMIFRFMLPDCQSLYQKKDYNQLEYFSIYIPVKKTSINSVDLERLEMHAKNMFNEHLLTMYAAILIFDSFLKYFKSIKDINKEYSDQLSTFYNKDFIIPLQISGFASKESKLTENFSIEMLFSNMKKICEDIYYQTLNYVKGLVQPIKISRNPYSGVICGYMDFLFPIISKIKSILLPNSLIFLLIDDADNLSYTQKKILNTWVSYRTSAEISLKISTQLNYNTFRTISGLTIDTPHDYSEVNISTVYTSSKTKYRDRVKEIVAKRLKKVGIPTNVEDFFPGNKKQEARIKEIYNKIIENFDKEGRGNRPKDDAYRYAIPNYIKELISKKAGNTYSYSGFNQLVNISSGIIRFFLEAAALMYSDMISKNNNKPITYIDDSSQNQIIRAYSDQFILNEFTKIKNDEDSDERNPKSNPLKISEKMRNLIHGMGGLFHNILLTELSERRVFSIALTDIPDEELSEVINFAIRYGYITESTIRSKDRIGRCYLYILSRRLAPYFLLDPSSFAGYKFMPSDRLKIALKDTQKFINTVLKNDKIDQSQRLLFPKEE